MSQRVAVGVVFAGLFAFAAFGCGENDGTTDVQPAKSALERKLELPPPPSHPPAAISTGESDRDGNKVDDAIDGALLSPRGATGATTPLDEAIDVAVFLEAPVTEADVRTFEAMGGSVRRFYRRLAYGFHGTLRRGATLQTAEALGDRLLLIEGGQATVPHLDEATRTGRVRPVWAAGFAGPGFQGSATTTIAVIDTGVDDAHSDLTGRMAYFADLTTDGSLTPEDHNGHGTHVAGIALGSGASFASTSPTLRYTDGGDLTGLANGAFFPSPIHLPGVALTFTSVARWNGAALAMHELGSRTQPGAGGPNILTAPVLQVTSPHTETLGLTPNANLQFMAFVANFPSGVTRFAAANSVTNYPVLGGGFPTMRGVAAGSRWAGFKVFTNAGGGTSLDLIDAFDELADVAQANGIKVANMSLGLQGSNMQSLLLRGLANSLVDTGVVVCVSAGNDGASGIVSDPARAARVLTIGSTNDVNQLTTYTSRGFLMPAPSEAMKPDVLAPGGSATRSMILAADTNDSDARVQGFPDGEPNDYANLQGTSMASPFGAGAAALVVEALESTGVVWSWSGNTQPLLVKMLLSASATETNQTRESGGNNPALGRAATPKDLEEGYGIINPDAAIEAVRLALGTGFSGTTAGGAMDRRAWGRFVTLAAGETLDLDLVITGTADFDVYLYSASPTASGEPVIQASSTAAGASVNESITFTASGAGTRYLFVKRVSGFGDFTLSRISTCGNGVVGFGEQCDDNNTAAGDCCSATCQFEAQASACGGPPSGACEGQDTCDGAGTCSDAGLLPQGSPCGSSSDTACDDPDTCSLAGVCEPNNVTGSCSDGNACNGNEVCGGGSCQAGTAPNCNDGNVCTTDSCVAATGCVSANNTASCSDGDACNGNEVCGGGSCQAGTAPNCNDGNVCTTDSCVAATGCVNANNTASCSDGDACNGNEVCGGGSCQAGTAPNCNDGNVCTTDSCVAATGCVNANNTASCSDGDACNGNEVCGGGSCQAGTAPNCNDGNVCTTDSCVAATGCVNANNTASCSDGDACNGNEVCGGGSCQAGTAPNCNDGNVCTTDSCNTLSGCVNTANTEPCPDGDVCNGAEICNGAGSCAPGTPLPLDDGNPCTADACTPQGGVSHLPVSVGTPCGDGNACNGAETCNLTGTCMPGSAVTCTASDECHLAGTCNPGNGTCTNPNAPDGTPCSLGMCSAGSCIPGGGGAGGASGAGGAGAGGAAGIGGAGGVGAAGAAGISGSGGAGGAGVAGAGAGGLGGAGGSGGQATGGRATGGQTTGGSAGDAGEAGASSGGTPGTGGSAGRGGSSVDEAGAGGDDAGSAGETGSRPRRAISSETSGCGCVVPGKSEGSGIPALSAAVVLLFAVRRRRARGAA